MDPESGRLPPLGVSRGGRPVSGVTHRRNRACSPGASPSKRSTRPCESTFWRLTEELGVCSSASRRRISSTRFNVAMLSSRSFCGEGSRSLNLAKEPSSRKNASSCPPGPSPAGGICFGRPRPLNVPLKRPPGGILSRRSITCWSFRSADSRRESVVSGSPNPVRSSAKSILYSVMSPNIRNPKSFAMSELKMLGEFAISRIVRPSRWAVWNADARRRELKGLCSSVHTIATRLQAAIPSSKRRCSCPKVSVFLSVLTCSGRLATAPIFPTLVRISPCTEYVMYPSLRNSA
mmetsp:Transcript_59750/g.141459  ORF Transcript_59750/g.141459 Transcript_59750/m.141459 type:complete len:291 (-) Transcript_59750:274-1146(-)